MRKRFDRSCAAGIFLAVTLLFTFCAGTGSAEASHHIDLMAQAIAKFYEEEGLDSVYTSYARTPAQMAIHRT